MRERPKITMNMNLTTFKISITHHNWGCDQMLSFCAKWHVSCKNGSWNCRKTRHHDSMYFRVCQQWQVRLKHQRPFRHWQEDVDARVQAFNDCRSKDCLQNPAKFEENPLNDSEVIKHRDAHAEEEYNRQNSEGKSYFFHHNLLSIDKSCTFLREVQKCSDFFTDALENSTTWTHSYAEDSQEKLKNEPANDWMPFDLLSMS